MIKTVKILAVSLILAGCSYSKEIVIEPSPIELNLLWDYYYIPGKGTVRGESRDYSNPVLNGSIDKDVIVLSDLSARINYINKDGSSKWDIQIKENGRPLRLSSMFKIDAENFLFCGGGKIYYAKIETGEIVKTEIIPEIVIRELKYLEDGSYLAVQHEKYSSNVFILNENKQIIWSDETRSNYPRSADILGNKVAVADTFGHRVYVKDLDQNIIAEFDEYYPNKVQFLNENEILVTGEHRNRVYIYNIQTQQKTDLYSCKQEYFDDYDMSLDDFLSIEKTGVMKGDPSSDRSKGSCAKEYNNGETLYSPNFAEVNSEGVLIIADTDNHRVLFIENGSISAEITNFDNPVGIIELD